MKATRCMLAKLLDLVEEEVVHHLREMVDEGWPPDRAGASIKGYLESVANSAVDRALAEQIWERE